MKQRCNNPKHTAAEWYHDRGIRVCPDWNDSFETFQQWAFENGYSDNLTIDRIDPDGNYEPDNCRWIPMRENLRRARKTGRAFHKRKPSYQHGRFMVVRKTRLRWFSDWYEVFEVGFTKTQARARVNELKSDNRNQLYEYRLFATDGHQVGETVHLSELRYYLTKRI